jgi:hypothetical protein
MICFSNLKRFEARDNKIDDLIELEMCNTLEFLDLKNNLIEEEENINFLSSLTELKYLNLNGNKIQKNEKYNELIEDYLNFIEKIDINFIEEKENSINFNDNENYYNNNKNINEIKYNNLNFSNEKMLDITNESFETRNQTKNSSMINSIDVNFNSSRPLSSNTNTLMNFYKINKNRNILDTDNTTRTTMDWKVANLINDNNNNNDNNNENDDYNQTNSPRAQGKEKIFNGIKSILVINRKKLKDISFNQDDNNYYKDKIEENSYDLNLNCNTNFHGYQTQRVFPSNGIYIDPLKYSPIKRNSNEINTKKVIRKPIILKANESNTYSNYNANANSKPNLNNHKNTFNKSDENFEGLSSKAKLPSNIIINFAKFKKEAQPILKPFIKKKVESNLDDNSEILKTQYDPKKLISTFNNYNAKPIIKKTIIFKQTNTNTINNNNNSENSPNSSMTKRLLNSALPNTGRVRII